MSIEIGKPWLRATPAELAAAPVGTGIYEVRDASGITIDIGYAGAREPFGLRSVLTAIADAAEERIEFRYESHVQYMSRYVELVLDYKNRHGSVPSAVADRDTHADGHIDPG